MKKWLPMIVLALAATLPARADVAAPGVPTPTETGTVGTYSYVYYQPSNWNQKTVLYLPAILAGGGYTFPDGYGSLTPNSHMEAPLVRGLLRRGFALAVPTGGYTEPGSLAQAAGAVTQWIETKRTPSRLYLMAGQSISDFSAIKLAETQPGLFSGVLTFDWTFPTITLALDYVYTFRAVYDYYAPGLGPILGQDPQKMFLYASDPATYLLPVIAKDCFPGLLTAQQDPTPTAACQEISKVTGVPANPLAYTSWLQQQMIVALAVEQLIGPTNNGWSNTGISYAGSSDDAALNKGIERFGAVSPVAQAYFSAADPTGKITCPVVNVQAEYYPTVTPQVLSAQRDAFHRFFDAGAGDRFAYYIEDDTNGDPQFYDLGFAAGMPAFDELVAWAEKGAKPTEEPRLVAGDLNASTYPSIYDATRALQAAIGAVFLTPAEFKAADVSPRSAPGQPYGDGKVGMDDVSTIIRLAIGTQDEP